MYDRNYTAIASFPNESVPLGKAVPCKYGWTFDHSEYKETIVTEVQKIILSLMLFNILEI